MSGRARNANRFTDDRLWDDDFGRPLRWVARDQRIAVWGDEVAANFADGGLRSDRARVRGRQPYVAGLWASDGAKLLVFESD